MVRDPPSIAEKIQSRVLEMTHYQVKNLVVEGTPQHLIVRGRVPTYHVKQLALQAALELLPGGVVCPEIEVSCPLRRVKSP